MRKLDPSRPLRRAMLVLAALALPLGCEKQDESATTPAAATPEHGGAITTATYYEGSIPRTVVVEDFTAVWCKNCKSVGRALGHILDDDQDEGCIPIQPHMADAYECEWSNERAKHYGLRSVPYAAFDGADGHAGSKPSDEENEQYIRTKVEEHRAATTDLAIELTGRWTADQTFFVCAKLTLEDTGTARDADVHVLTVLDNYPATRDGHFRNCVMEGTVHPGIALTPGETVLVEQELPLDGPCWDHRDQLSLVVWAQTPEADGPAAVIYQAAALDWDAMVAEDDWRCADIVPIEVPDAPAEPGH